MVHISMGSNLGHRLNYLRQAVNLLKARYLKNVRTSIVLETACILPPDAPLAWNRPFLNMVVSGETTLSPERLLRGLKSIEHEMGRPHVYERWSPRVIDLDILLWGELEHSTAQLTIPHPELENRPFLCHLLALMGVDEMKTRPFPSCFSKSFMLYPQLVGVTNITLDSFSDGGRFDAPDKAIAQVIKLAAEGASVVEIGAQSTRPGAQLQSPNEEMARLKPVLDGLQPLMQEGVISISVDSFRPSVIHKILDHYPVSWINDVSGELDEITLKRIAERDCKLCIMHSLGIPPQKGVVLLFNQSPILAVMAWAEKNLNRLIKLGFKQDNVIIDPGIGFGKTTYQSIDILQQLDVLKPLGSPLLIGHSRKSYLEAFSTAAAPHRDVETLATSAALAGQADFLRVHNVADHMRFFASYQSLMCKLSPG